MASIASLRLAGLLFLALVGCAGAETPVAETARAEAPAAIPLEVGTPAPAEATPVYGAAGAVIATCAVDADCVVKNVGSCCGYMPACVHKDSPTFPERVKAECEAKGISSICGFQEPAGCACVDGRCASTGAGIGGSEVK